MSFTGTIRVVNGVASGKATGVEAGDGLTSGWLSATIVAGAEGVGLDRRTGAILGGGEVFAGTSATVGRAGSAGCESNQPRSANEFANAEF